MAEILNSAGHLYANRDRANPLDDDRPGADEVTQGAVSDVALVAQDAG